MYLLELITTRFKTKIHTLTKHTGQTELLNTENFHKAIMETDLDLQTRIFPQSSVLDILHFLKSLPMYPSFNFII